MSAETSPTQPDSRTARRERLFDRLHYGGDYNPEQWPESVWDEDVTLMQRAGVTIATVAVFSWARLEPRPGEYEFGWLDAVLDRLHAGGVRVMLATATASPPPWLPKLHPESLPVTADGVRLGPGSRQHYSPSSSAYREHAMGLVERIVTRYGTHPALAAWHVNNEYGCHVSRSYDPESEAAFRVWLTEKYTTVDALNAAWSTSFWSQHYGSFDEIDVPRAMPTFPNPTQALDFERFSSDALIGLYQAELEIIRRLTPDVPVTTNFMGFFRNADYWSWAPHLDLVSDDVYPDPTDPESYVGMAAQRDLMRSLGGGAPWLLMESATSAVQWRDLNPPKPAGMHRAELLQAVARGADGVLHFQWRQSSGGAERFHSAMVPHAGPDSRMFREVCAIGEELSQLAPRVLGEPVPAKVGIVLDWDSWWAVEQAAMPTTFDYRQHVIDWYRAFLRSGIAVDFCSADADLSVYSLVVAPMMHVAGAARIANIDSYVRAGGHLVVGYFSAVVDQDLHTWLGGYLGPLGQTLGVRVEEFAPYAPGAAPLGLDGDLVGNASQWQDVVVVDDAQVVARFVDGFAAGLPAITFRHHDAGVAWYVGTMPDPEALDRLVARWSAEAGVPRLLDAPCFGVEAVVRGDLTFLINHTGSDTGVELRGEAVLLKAYEVQIRSEPA